MTISYDFQNRVNMWITHYNPQKYWHAKEKLRTNCPNLKKYLLLFYLKRCDSLNCASLGHDIQGGSVFSSIPDFPHGIKGIFVHPKSVIGNNAVIYQQVTIGHKNRGGGTSHW